MKIVTVNLRNQKVSPRKGQLVVGLVRNMPAEKALDQLTFTNKKAATFVKALLKSALSAAKEKDYSATDLYISEAICQEGPRYKRFYIRARGRSTSFHKRLSHFKISLSKIDAKADAKVSDEKEKATKTEVKENKKKEKNGTKS